MKTKENEKRKGRLRMNEIPKDKPNEIKITVSYVRVRVLI